MPENFLEVQWLGPGALTTRGLDLIPCRGTKILQASWHGQKKTKNKKIYKCLMQKRMQ